MMNNKVPDDVRLGGASAFEQYGKDARLDARMLDADNVITDEQRIALIRELQNYRDNNKTPQGKPMPWAEVGTKAGLSGSVLVEIVKGKYSN